MQNRNKVEIKLKKKSLSTKLPTEEWRTVGKMNGTAVANRLQNSFKITGTDHRIIEILGLRPSNRLPVSYYKRVIPLVWIPNHVILATSQSK